VTDELRDLCSAAAEGALTPEQSRRLEELVRADPRALAYLVEHLHLHATLAWAAGNPALLRHEGASPAAARRRARRRPRLAWAGWAVAACLLVGLAFGVLRPAKPHQFARLAEADGCKWDSGTLPTEAGARLGAGRLRLSEGVARLVFDNGAEVRLEGPADLELASGWEVTLHRGRLVARCPEAAHGFAVRTPTADLKDYGTEFGVSVPDGTTADVQVFEGRVDVTHRATAKVEQLVTGRGMRFTPDAAVPTDPKAEDPRTADPQPALLPGRRMVTITTATGRGRDAYVEGKPNLPNRSDVLILVKTPPADKLDYARKGYIGFDLRALAGARVESAQLSLTQAATAMGYASECPDATFTLYGVTDDALSDWPEAGLTWDAAPANAPGGAAVDPAKTVKLGQFHLRQGVQTGVSAVGGPALADFLNTRTRLYATVILVRDTPGSGRHDYVHGFAGKDHPSLPPPTLKLVVQSR